jgi:5'-deoxynucleotidase YfbR-like HD superfamily hydrolase
MDTRGDWIQTYTGQRFYLFSPRADEVVIEDIAFALAKICRFGGHSRVFYSVGQHSLVVDDLVARWWLNNPGKVSPFQAARLRLAALLHDGSEAYIGDVVRPLKRQLAAYKAIETQIQLAVMARFQIEDLMDEIELDTGVVKQADNLALALERHKVLLPTDYKWRTDVLLEGVDYQIQLRPAEAVPVVFLERFQQLYFQVCELGKEQNITLMPRDMPAGRRG